MLLEAAVVLAEMEEMLHRQLLVPEAMDLQVI
jgi:hypothetical protein